MEREEHHWKELTRPQKNSRFLALTHTSPDIPLAKEFTTLFLKVVEYQTEKMPLAVNSDELSLVSRTHLKGGDNGPLYVSCNFHPGCGTCKTVHTYKIHTHTHNTYKHTSEQI